jgi:hypothetical protein
MMVRITSLHGFPTDPAAFDDVDDFAPQPPAAEASCV